MARSGLVPLFALLATSAVGGASAQTAPDGVTTHWSPMVLEVPAEAIQAMRGGLTWRVSGFDGHFCEGFSIPEVAVETSGDPGMRLKVSFDAYVTQDGSRGRKATLLLELVVDGQVVGAAEKERFHVSAGKRKRVSVKMELSPVDSTIFRMGTETALRATLYVLD